MPVTVIAGVSGLVLLPLSCDKVSRALLPHPFLISFSGLQTFVWASDHSSSHKISATQTCHSMRPRNVIGKSITEPMKLLLSFDFLLPIEIYERFQKHMGLADFFPLSPEGLGILSGFLPGPRKRKNRSLEPGRDTCRRR